MFTFSMALPKTPSKIAFSAAIVDIDFEVCLCEEGMMVQGARNLDFADLLGWALKSGYLEECGYLDADPTHRLAAMED